MQLPSSLTHILSCRCQATYLKSKPECELIQLPTGLLHIRMLFGCPAAYYTSEMRWRTSSPGLVATALAYPLLAVSVSVQFKTLAENEVNHVSSDVGVFPTRSKRMWSHWVFLHAFKTQISTRAPKYLVCGCASLCEFVHEAMCMHVRARACMCMVYVPACVYTCAFTCTCERSDRHLLLLI